MLSVSDTACLLRSRSNLREKKRDGGSCSEYRSMTVPIYTYYDKRGVCKTIDGAQAIQKVLVDIPAAMGKC